MQMLYQLATFKKGSLSITDYFQKMTTAKLGLLLDHCCTPLISPPPSPFLASNAVPVYSILEIVVGSTEQMVPRNIVQEWENSFIILLPPKFYINYLESGILYSQVKKSF